MAEVYALFSGRDGKVRYVGDTGGSRYDRFKRHYRGQIGRRIMPAEEWIRAEWRRGFPVRCREVLAKRYNFAYAETETGIRKSWKNSGTPW